MTRKIILHHHLSPGDVVCMTAAVRDLHRNHPDKFITDVRTSASELWEHSPFITPIDEKAEAKAKKLVKLSYDDDKENEKVDYNMLRPHWEAGKTVEVKLDYPLIHRPGQTGHFIDGFCNHLEKLTGVRIEDRKCYGSVIVSEEEASWLPQVEEITGHPTSYWIVVNGGKTDYTNKWWDPFRMQKVVSAFPHLTFVQVGENNKGHVHNTLVGQNVINLLGKTSLREIVRLMYHASGVICPVTFLMHLSAAVPANPAKCYGRNTRPCIVIAGGREPMRWEAYGEHTFLHTCGMLPCCSDGGCWKSRIKPLDDGEKHHDESLCELPTVTENNVIIPKCMAMQSVDKVVQAIKDYLPN